MCGIAGIVNLTPDAPPPSTETLARMAGALSHRGPDEFGLYRDQIAGLSHARLSIIDLASGQQPLCNEDGTLWVSFNGEIFNYLELRDELEALGHVFKTRSDTEVIVHAYEQWRSDAFKRFNGQWAIALWNTVDGFLVLARDPFGVRPLYYTEHDGRRYFASEVKAIFAADDGIPRRIDPDGVNQVFTFWCTVAPRTVFEGIEEVEPGGVLTFSKGTCRREWCWSEQLAEPVPTLEEAVVLVRDALDKATNLRMLRSDVPVGSYLSGGLDSSMVAALGLRAKGSKFSTFSLRFADAEYDETSYQREMARFLGSEHHEVLVSRDDIAQVFPQVIRHTERPILRTAPAPLFLLSKLVHDHGIKVVLTGEGADELFGGYDLFREAKVRRFWARQPQSAWRHRLLERLYPYLERSPVSQRAMTRQFFGQHLTESNELGFGHGPRWRGTTVLKRLFDPEFSKRIQVPDSVSHFVAALPPSVRGHEPLAQDQYIEIKTLLAGYLLSSQGDRMLMANSVEGRFPFLDRNVAALAGALPDSYKLRVLDEKHVLKRAAEGLVPSSIVRRPKQPYRAPDALSFCSPAATEWIDEVASAAAIAEAGVFSRAARQLIDKCLATGGVSQFSNADNMAMVGVLSTQLLHHTFVRSRSDVRPIRSIRTIIDRVGAMTGTP